MTSVPSKTATTIPARPPARASERRWRRQATSPAASAASPSPSTPATAPESTRPSAPTTPAVIDPAAARDGSERDGRDRQRERHRRERRVVVRPEERRLASARALVADREVVDHVEELEQPVDERGDRPHRDRGEQQLEIRPPPHDQHHGRRHQRVLEQLHRGHRVRAEEIGAVGRRAVDRRGGDHEEEGRGRDPDPAPRAQRPETLARAGPQTGQDHRHRRQIGQVRVGAVHGHSGQEVRVQEEERNREREHDGARRAKSPRVRSGRQVAPLYWPI